MKSEPENLSPYEARYGDVLEAVSRAFAEAAGSGDEIGFLFLLESISAIVRHAEKVLNDVHRSEGHA
jgi:hypothetical protein